MTTVPSCATCQLVDVYVENTESYIAAVSEIMFTPMSYIFVSLVGIWISIQGLKMIAGSGDLIGFFRGIAFVVLASGLLSIGSDLTLNVYNVAIAVIGGAASDVMSAAALADPEIALLQSHAAAENYTGVTRLAYVVEGGFLGVIDKAWVLWKSFSIGNLTGPLTGVLIIIPWFFLIVVYFSQIIVTLFRVAVIVALAPFVLLGVGFEWSRSMIFKAIKSLIAAGLVLYGATFAVGISLFAVGQIGFSDGFGAGSLFTGDAFVAIILGIMGALLVTEATAIANSIAESQFTNTVAAGMTGSAVAAGMVAIKKFGPPGVKQAANLAGKATDAAEAKIDKLRNGFIDRG